MEIIHLIIGAGILAVVYGIVTSISVLSADTGNEKMQEIAGAIQEGASAVSYTHLTLPTILRV